VKKTHAVIKKIQNSGALQKSTNFIHCQLNGTYIEGEWRGGELLQQSEFLAFVYIAGTVTVHRTTFSMTCKRVIVYIMHNSLCTFILRFSRLLLPTKIVALPLYQTA